MAIVKHIKSRNANYSAAINYLLFEHDEKTGKKIVDESGRSIMRKEFYMDVRYVEAWYMKANPTSIAATMIVTLRSGKITAICRAWKKPWIASLDKSLK